MGESHICDRTCPLATGQHCPSSFLLLGPLTVFREKLAPIGELDICPYPKETRRHSSHHTHPSNIQRPTGICGIIEIGRDTRRGRERPNRACGVAHCFSRSTRAVNHAKRLIASRFNSVFCVIGEVFLGSKTLLIHSCEERGGCEQLIKGSLATCDEERAAPALTRPVALVPIRVRRGVGCCQGRGATHFLAGWSDQQHAKSNKAVIARNPWRPNIRRRVRQETKAMIRDLTDGGPLPRSPSHHTLFTGDASMCTWSKP